MDNRKMMLAMMELNMKFHTMLEMYDEDFDLVVSKLQNDLAAFEKEFGIKLYYDGNYTWTWGIYQFGMYETLTECEEVSKIVSRAID